MAYNHFKIPQVDHLILLVGSNPLPNLVVADVLVKDDGAIYLLHTKETKEIAKRLKDRITAQKTDKSIEISLHNISEDGDRSPTVKSIENEIKKIVSLITEGTIGLNYTGGTKFMGVHSYLALERLKKENVNFQFSYLDASSMSVVVMDQNGEATCSLRNKVKITLDDMIFIHGWEYHTDKKPKTKPVNIEVAEYILKIMQKRNDTPDWDKYRNCLHNIRKENNGAPKKKNQLFAISPEEQIVPNILSKLRNEPYTESDNIQFKIEGWKKAEDVFKWMEGNWLEDLTMDVIQQLEFKHNDESFTFDETGLGANLKSNIGSEIEIDVYGIIDFQFFLFSVTTDATKGLCKSKLMEAYVRARQLGGDEACVALVCLANEKTVKEVGEELQSLFQGSGSKIRVFGINDWTPKDDHEMEIFSKIRNWVSTIINQ